MTTKSAQNTSLEVRRFINVPRDRVYAAWTDPAQLRQWFGPATVETDNLIADVRPGGEFRWDLRNCDGKKMTIRGEYRQVQPGKRIVFTWQWQDDEDWKGCVSLVTVELSDRDRGTEVCLTHTQLPNQESRDSHNEGWNSVLEKLETFVTK